jgi:hypothetical protein
LVCPRRMGFANIFVRYRTSKVNSPRENLASILKIASNAA